VVVVVVVVDGWMSVRGEYVAFGAAWAGVITESAPPPPPHTHATTTPTQKDGTYVTNQLDDSQYNKERSKECAYQFAHVVL
jgi:hypothetical protein